MSRKLKEAFEAYESARSDLDNALEVHRTIQPLPQDQLDAKREKYKRKRDAMLDAIEAVGASERRKRSAARSAASDPGAIRGNKGAKGKV